MDGNTIGALAKAGEVGVETVRYYQRRGLLPTPARDGGNALSGGIRRYGAEDLRRLRFIRQAQAAGFTLEEIGTLLSLDATEDRNQARAWPRDASRRWMRKLLICRRRERPLCTWLTIAPTVTALARS